MIPAWLKRLFGYHVHDYGLWYPIYASDQSVAGRMRRCTTCPHVQSDYYPDGH